MSQDLYDQISEDLPNRLRFEQKQRIWWELRHTGLRRKKMPFPGAADMHFPLIDTQIEKQKPYYVQQLYGSELLANFIGRGPESRKHASAAAQWFDYQLREETNFERQMILVVDYFLQDGGAWLKVLWSEKAKSLRFEAIENTGVIVPSYCEDAQKPEWVVHIRRLSVQDYKRRKEWNQDEDYVKSIQGRSVESGPVTAKDTVRKLREGVSTAANDEEILIWEVYKDTENGIEVHTFSPKHPEEPCRKPFRLPYTHGQMPFIFFEREVKGNSPYDPRGLAEWLAPFQTSLTKTWNEKLDAMTFYNRPIYTADGDLNVGNVRLAPGEVVKVRNGKLNRLDMGQPPISFDQEMAQTRMTGEQLTGSPDFGIGGSLNTPERKTAREVEQIAAVNQSSGDLRARTFRLCLSRTFRQAWALLAQFKAKERDYFFREELLQADESVFQVKFVIQPSVSANGETKETRVGRAAQRFSMFRGDPFVDQAGLRKDVLEQDDPSLVQKLFVNPGLTEARQLEDQAQELSVMLLGFPAAVEMADDDKTHISACLQYIDAQRQLGQAIPPVAQQRIMEHVQQHFAQWEQKDPKAAHAARKQVIQMLQPRMASGPAQQQVVQ